MLFRSVAVPTSIRGAYGRLTTKGVFENVVHASSYEQEAEREIRLWFRPDELLQPVLPTAQRVVPQQTLVTWAA